MVTDLLLLGWHDAQLEEEISISPAKTPRTNDTKSTRTPQSAGGVVVSRS